MMITAWAVIDIPGSVPLGPRRSQAGTVRGMRTPMTIGGHLDRAALVYGDRIGIVDEPDAPGGGLGPITYRRARGAGPGPGGHPRRAGHRARRAGGRPLAERGRAPHLVLRRERLRARAGADQLPAEPRGDRVHRRALAARRCCSSTPSWPTPSPHIPVQAPRSCSARTPTASCSSRAASPSRGREQDEDATATINYTSGTTARPKGVQMTHRNLWLNAVTFGWHMGVTDRDIYLHTLPMFHCNGWGMPYALTGDGRAAGGDPQDRRRRHPAPHRRARRHVARAARRPWSPTVLDAAADVGRARSPAAGRTRMVVAGAPPPTADHRAGRDRARLGVHPDLRPHRDVAAAHHQPRPRRVGRPRRPPSGPPAVAAPACPRSACACRSTARARCWPAATTCSRATGSSPRRPPTAHRRRLVPHRRRRRPRRRRLRRDHATARRT